ncbi:MAG: carboxypeptidase regulatory-like domain-containing protein [Planctomycetota bacterium]|jgi:plastocyanin
MRQRSIWFGTSVIALLFGVSMERLDAAARSRYKEVDLKESGAIVGVVKYDGKVEKPKRLDITTEEHVCHKDPIYSEELVVSADKRIKWAVVSIKKIKQGKPFPKGPLGVPVKDNPSKEDPKKPAKPKVAQIDQIGCRFVPHIAVVPEGKPLKVLNSDDILHNVHTYSKFNRKLNKAMPKTMKEMDVSFKRRERIKLRCDIHKWMAGWIVVAEHPYYAVTGEKGKFQLEKVPVGTHKVEVWHETLGKQEKEVTVKAGEKTKVEFVFKKKK